MLVNRYTLADGSSENSIIVPPVVDRNSDDTGSSSSEGGGGSTAFSLIVAIVSGVLGVTLISLVMVVMYCRRVKVSHVATLKVTSQTFDPNALHAWLHNPATFILTSFCSSLPGLLKF